MEQKQENGQQQELSWEQRRDNLPKLEEHCNKAKTLIRRKHAFLHSIKEIADLKEPVLLLMRRGHKIEIFEDVKAEEYEFHHSTGTDEKMFLNPKYLHSLSYGAKDIKVYIAHEDDYYPYPKDPLFEVKQIRIAMEKLMNDIMTWKTKQLKERNQMIINIAIGIAIVVAAYTVYKMMTPSAPQVVQITMENITKAITQQPGVTIVP